MKPASDTKEHTIKPRVNSSRLIKTAKLLADAKSSLLEDLNVESLPASASSDLGNSFGNSPLIETKKEPERPLKTFSRASKVRAERVRSYIQYFYDIMEREIENGEMRILHPGVEGVYNPLQTIRNRKLKKKNRSVPTSDILFMKSPILAIKDFSRNSQKPQIWFVDVSERFSDLTWRTSHWNELKRPDGYKWFKKDSTDMLLDMSGNQHRSQPREHSRTSSQGYNQSLATKNGVPQISVEDFDHLDKSGESDEVTRAVPNQRLGLPVSKLTNSRDSREADAHSTTISSNSVGNSEKKFFSEAGGTKPPITEIPIHSVRNSIMENGDVASEKLTKPSVELLELGEPFHVDERARETKRYQDLRYVACTWRLMHYRQETLQTVRDREFKKRKPIQIENAALYAEPTATAMSIYEAEVAKALETCESWKSRLLNDYSMRVDKLISSSDRILSDINTTLTLRLKMLNENMDKFGTLNTMNKEPFSLAFYRVLEFVIMVLFWMVWFVFSVLKCGKLTIKAAGDAAKWIVW
ncbi:LAMI_0B04940g1_1 [Lachancea mirantina]|uniref:LAMI_0B04940g1_1 n=1 Tax=Lachancea mirantina TaxID=1230905 RepID=A0A1G4IVV9_9SACH|nr:LAMI_0B04940g1_1 [Lachancea mirantina]